MAISKRLKAIAKYIEGYDTLADIACDHGYLGIYAVEEYNLKEVFLFRRFFAISVETFKE